MMYISDEISDLDHPKISSDSTMPVATTCGSSGTLMTDPTSLKKRKRDMGKPEDEDLAGE
jgi:hypothetical protein